LKLRSLARKFILFKVSTGEKFFFGLTIGAWTGYFMKFMDVEPFMMLAINLMQRCRVFLGIKLGCGNPQELKILLRFKVSCYW
jgi:hypothetical protein